MRTFIAKTDTSLNKLGATLLESPSATSATLERIKALNPQVADFQRIAAGTVLILPDATDLKPGAGSAVGAEGFSDLTLAASSGLRALALRAAKRFDTLVSDHAAVKDSLKSAAAKRLVESDPALVQRLKAADAQFKIDQKAAKESKAKFDELQKAAEEEFKRLLKLLGQ